MMVSCSEQKPKHLIVGKWESKQTPTLKLTFDSENNLKGKILSSNGHIYKYNHKYLIIDETKVEMIDTSVGPKVIMQATIYEEKLSFRCDYKRIPNEPMIVDFPTLCYYREYIQVK